MRILAVASAVPTRDRSTGAYRFFSLLDLIAKRHQVHLHARDLASQESHFVGVDVDAYKKALKGCDGHVTDGTPGVRFPIA